MGRQEIALTITIGKCVFATKPESPVSQIAISSNYDMYAEPESVLQATFVGPFDESVLASLHDWGMKTGIIKEHALPKIDRLVFSGPATVTLFSDNTKCVTKCKDGDDYDPLFGVMACLVRKLTRNRGHAVDDYEPELKAIASEIQSPDDVKRLIGHYAVILNTLTMLDESSDKWLEHLGECDETECEESADQPSSATSSRINYLERLVSEQGKNQDAIRQEIRDLIDRGEL